MKIKLSEQKISLKTFVLTTTLTALLVVSVAYYSFSVGTEITIEPNSFHETASYVVWTDGTHVYAKNGATGQIDYSGTDAWTVIQNVVNVVGAKGGGKILLKDGVYSLSNEITIPYYDYVIIEGESWNTVLKTNGGNYNAIHLYGSDTDPNVGCVIRNLKIDGGASTQGSVWNQQNGIMTTYTQDSTFERLFITKMGRTGIYNTQFSHRNLIFNNFLYQNYRYGISYTSSSRGRVIGNYIKENYDFGMNWDATYGENYYTTIANNIFENNTDTDLYIIGSSGSHAMYGTIVGNTFYSGWQTSTGTSFAAIKLIGANYITIANNVFRIKATAPGSSVFVVGGDSSNIVFTGNVVFMDNVYAGWNSYGTSLLIEGNQISGNGGQAVYLGFAQNVTVSGNFFNGPILAIGPSSDPCSGSDVIIKDNHFNCTGKIANNVLSHISNLVIKGNYGFTTENSGTATVANGEYVAHGLDSSLNIGPSNSTVTVTPYTVTYAGVPVVVGCSFVNGTHIQISAYWTNGTAITDDAIQVWWKVTYP